jgi:hypothetical protein
MQYTKHFKLDEARNLLPDLKNKLSNIRKLTLKLQHDGFDIYKGKYRPGFHPDTLVEYPTEYQEIKTILKYIFDLGIEIKGLEQGLIDFPAIRDNGEEVFLCWKLDEEDIEFWHPMRAGYKGRKHIDDF